MYILYSLWYSQLVKQIDVGVTSCDGDMKLYIDITDAERAASCNTGLSKKMDGIWNRYNLKSTGRIYTFGILICSEKFSFRLTLVHL